MTQPTAIAVAEARRAIHELLTALPAWDADKVRDALTHFEQVHRDQVLTEAAELIRQQGADCCAGEHVEAHADLLLAARTAPQEQEAGR